MPVSSRITIQIPVWTSKRIKICLPSYSSTIRDPQEVEMQNLNSSNKKAPPPPAAGIMAEKANLNKKGNRFEHVLERATTALQEGDHDAKEDRKPSAIPEDVLYYMHDAAEQQEVVSKPPADIILGRTNGKGNRHLQYDPVQEKHAKKGMDEDDEQARAAASSRVGSYHVNRASIMGQEYVGAYRIKGGEVMQADAEGSSFFFESNVVNEGYCSKKQLIVRASTQSRPSAFAGGGLVAAEAIESEAIVYAEASHDTSKRNLCLIYLFGCIAIAAILIGTLVPNFLNQQEDGDGEFLDSRCLLSAEDQNVVSHCLCRGSTGLKRRAIKCLKPSDDDGLRDLYLDRNHLIGSLPDELENLKSLEVVDISRNMLEGTLPEWFGLNTRLEIVDIIESGISGPVPESYWKHPELLADRVIIGNCEGRRPMIPDCSCCDRVALQVSWCVEDFPQDTLGLA